MKDIVFIVSTTFYFETSSTDPIIPWLHRLGWKQQANIDPRDVLVPPPQTGTIPFISMGTFETLLKINT
jgi:hypothetical protein